MSEEQQEYDAGPVDGEAVEEKPEAQPEPGQEVAVRKEPKPPITSGEKGYIVPTTMDEAYRYAVGVVHGGLAPNSYDNDPSKVMLGVLAALEAGLPPMFGLRNIAIINGRPTIWGDAAMALLQSAKVLTNQKTREIGTQFDPGLDREQWPDDFGFSVSLWRKGQEDPYVGTFTIGEAKRAGLWNKRSSPWLTYPKRMLMIRARSFPLRDGFADALAGLAIREEVEDYDLGEVEKVTEARNNLLKLDMGDDEKENDDVE